MKIGNTNFETYTRIRIKDIKGTDKFLNGKEGTLTHPFGCFPSGDVGVYLDNTKNTKDICNLFIGEFEII